MFKYISYRVGYGVLVALGVVTVLFFLFNILPISSARMTMGQRGDAATEEAIAKQLKLNYSTPKRYLLYLNDISPISIYTQKNTESGLFYDTTNYHGFSLGTVNNYSLFCKIPYLGRSFQTRSLVSEILLPKIYMTFILALGAIILASFVGIILGIISALFANSWIDRSAMFLSVLGVSLPSYFMAILFAMIFGYYLEAYTGLNVRGSLIELDDYGDRVFVWKNMILPLLALGIRPIAIISQMTRNSMLDVLSQDYVRTATAKGLDRKTVILKHALRNALNPVITSISGWFGSLLAGAYFIEMVFDFKGLGHQTVVSLMKFDFPVVMGAALFIAASFVVINIISDVLYAILDPRISMK